MINEHASVMRIPQKENKKKFVAEVCNGLNSMASAGGTVKNVVQDLAGFGIAVQRRPRPALRREELIRER